MQSGDQIKETLEAALGAQYPLNMAGITLQNQNQRNLSDPNSPLSQNSRKSLTYKRKNTQITGQDNGMTGNSQRFSFKSQFNKRNPISEGPFNPKLLKRSEAVQRNDMNVRNRIFSQDLNEIQSRRIDQAQNFRKSALAHYKKGDYFDALTQLHKAVKQLKVEKLTEEVKEQNEQIYGIIKDCYLFSASCYVKINQYESAIQLMNEVLDIEESNVKALYLRGKAHYHRKEILQAYIDFQQAIQYEPENQILNGYVHEIKNSYPNVIHQINDSLASRSTSFSHAFNDFNQSSTKKSQFFGHNSTHSTDSHHSNELDQQLLLRKSTSLQHSESTSNLNKGSSSNIVARSRINSQNEKYDFFNKVTLIMFLKGFWKQHKPQIVQMMWTVIILLAIFLFKRALQKFLPDELRQKILRFLQ